MSDDFFASWSLDGPTPEDVIHQTRLLHVERGDGTMLIWLTGQREAAPPITEHPPRRRAVDCPTNPVGWLTIPVSASLTVHERRDLVGLPPQPFLYTLDQIATMLQRTEATVAKYLHFAGISPGKCPEDRMLAANLASVGEAADWRVADAEFIRYLRYKGLKVYDAWGLSQ